MLDRSNREFMTANQYEQHWAEARQQAILEGMQIIEHGYEQHVAIDEANGLVYRYPKHAAAAAKLYDEIDVLNVVHQREWSTELPRMLDHNPIFSTYNYIPGEVLSEELAENLTVKDFEIIGGQLGIFLSEFHTLDTSIIDLKGTKQSISLLQYYAERIEGAKNSPFYETAAQILEKVAQLPQKSVVVHGDLHGLNMVINPESKSLNGVIDLSEMEVGDPHQDFRKLFMADPRLLEPAIATYNPKGTISAETAKDWAYLNEWANLCYFAGQPENATYQRALNHLQKWQQI